MIFQSNLRYIISEPRNFLIQQKNKFDLVLIPILGSFRGTVGLQAMQENNILSSESFKAIWNSLTTDGVLSVSSWLDSPPRIPYKLAAMLGEMLENEGVNYPEDQIVAIRSWNTISYCVKRTAFGEKELNRLKEFCDKNSFDLLLPDMNIESQFNVETNHAHTFWGLCTRLYSKLTAHTLCIYINRLLGKADFLQIKGLAFPN